MDQQERGRSNSRQRGNSHTDAPPRQDGEQTSDPTREPAEGSRETVRANMPLDEPRMRSDANRRGDQRGGGISNRGMDPATEQRELPDRGTAKDTER